MTDQSSQIDVRVLEDGTALRRSLLTEHSRAWDDMTVRRLVRGLDDLDLGRLLVATSPLVRGDSEIDRWLHDLVRRDVRRRTRRVHDVPEGYAA